MAMTSAGGPSPDLAPLQADVRAWRAEVVKFASTAALKLQTSTLGSTGSTFVPPPTASGGRNSEIRARNAQYKLAVAQQQLNLSYERSKEASNKLDDVNHHLADVLGQIASIDIQKQNVSFKIDVQSAYNGLTDTRVIVGGNCWHPPEGDRLSCRTQTIPQRSRPLLHRHE